MSFRPPLRAGWVFWPWVFSVLLATLPLGSARPLPAALLGMLTGVALLLDLTASFRYRDQPRSPLRPLLPAALALALALLWGWLQTWSGAPLAWHHPLWQEAARALGHPLTSVIALHPHAAREALLQHLTSIGIFLLAFQSCRSRRRAGQLITALALAGTAYALYGLWVHVSGSATILGMDKWAYREDLTATFVNRNHFATYAGLTILCLLALLQRELLSHMELLTWRERVRFLFSGGDAARVWGWGLALVVILSALFLTGSRGGMVSLVCGATMLVLTSGLRRRALLLLLPLLAVILVGGGVIIDRLLHTDLLEEERIKVFAATLDAMAARPWVGIGLEGFAPLFLMQRPMGQPFWDHAHNSYLELLVELGIPAALLVFTALALVMRGCWKGCRNREDSLYPALGLAAGTLCGVHALVDFSVQIPAIAVTLAALLGMGWAQALRRADISAATGRGSRPGSGGCCQNSGDPAGWVR